MIDTFTLLQEAIKEMAKATGTSIQNIEKQYADNKRIEEIIDIMVQVKKESELCFQK